MIISNPARYDTRVLRESETLQKNGYSVIIYAWDREGKYPIVEEKPGILIQRIRIRSSYKNPFLFLITAPIFWLVTLLKILRQDTIVIHCHDFDTMPIGLIMKILKRHVKIIYDAHEIYPMMISRQIPHLLLPMLNLIDRLFMKTADCVLIPCEERRRFYLHARKIVIVPNTPKTLSVPRNRKNDRFTLFYGGGLSEENGILTMLKAIMGLPNLIFILAGDGPLRPMIEQASRKNLSIKYLGLIPLEKILENLANADATFVLYEPINLNKIYAASNKLFEAMMIGVPIIVNQETVLAKIVEKFKCGVIVPYGDIYAIRQAIIQLKDDFLTRQKMGENGKNAFIKNYAWDLFESKFIKTYEENTLKM